MTGDERCLATSGHTSNITCRCFRMMAERSEKLSADLSGLRAAARAPRWVVPAVKAALVAADVCVAVASFVAAYVLREGFAPIAGFGDGGGGPLAHLREGVWLSAQFQHYA